MLKFSLHIAGRTLTLLRKIFFSLLLFLAFVFAGLILILRYSVLPDIERYHADITDSFGKIVGQVVEIGRIEADWHGMDPRLSLTDIRILDKQKRTRFALQRVDVVVSWMTLLAGELRLSSLEIDQPDLMVKRDAQGGVNISGVQLEGGSTDNNFANMLLNQSRIVVRGAHISWLDEMQHKPMLVFDDVNLLIENSWNFHRFSVRGLPPSELSTQLDLRGNLYGHSFDDIKSWKGEFFAQLDYVDFAAWKTWLPLPEHFKQGRGAFRGWLSIADGKLSQLTADLALANVQTRLAVDLPPLDIQVLRGRIGWKDVEQGFEIFLDHFSLKLFDDFVLKPTDIFARLSNEQQKNTSAGEFRASLLELEGIAKLMEYFPLEHNYKTQFAEFLPKGRIENLKVQWQSDKDKQLHYKVKGKFTDLSLQRVGKTPGFSGLTGEIDGNEKKGTVSISSRKFKVDAPQFMPDELAFDTIAAESSWHTNSKGVEVILRNCAVSNEDVSGTAYGSYQTLADSPGIIDLNVHLKRVSVPHAVKYIPLIALGDGTIKWLNRALKGGQSNDFNLRLKGDLNDFPFVGYRKGIFKINARMNGVALEFDPDWPRIENGIAELLIQGKKLAVTASSAMTAGLQLQNVSVTVPDLLSKDAMLNIRGDAKGSNAHALEYIQLSPVRGYLEGFTDDIAASGNGSLVLKLDIPLQGTQKVKVAGIYHFTDSVVDFSRKLPALRNVNGDLEFTESGVSTHNIAAQILGGPAKLVIDSHEDGRMSIKLNGRANLSALQKENPSPALKKLTGDPVWNVDIAVKDKLSKVLLTSSLLGLQSDLPAPLSKQAEESIPLRFEMNDVGINRKLVTLQYGSFLNANLIQRKRKDEEWSLERGIVNFGNVVQKADRDGLWVIGTLPEVSLEGWGEVADAVGGRSGNSQLRVAGADFSIQKLRGYGNLVHDLHIKASYHNNILSAQLASKELNGDLSWRDSIDHTGDSGRLFARLKNLELGLDVSDEVRKIESEVSHQGRKSAYTELPTIDLTIDRLGYKSRHIGRFELQSQQQEQNYQINHLRLSNSDGVLDVNGIWNQSSEVEETRINLKLDLSNAGNMLSRAGFPNSVKNGSGKIEGALAWPGEPWVYSKAGLNGNLSLDTVNGQFLQIEPGMGKLLSILSLQALPKRIVLDFEDVFSNGFEFDSIQGSADIKEGVMHTDNFKIDGSAAKAFMAGNIDLAKETQDLRVRIVPTVGNSAALISALVATPITGAYVYLASKLFNDPLGQLVSFEYKISGSWVDPKVEKTGGKKQEKSTENN